MFIRSCSFCPNAAEPDSAFCARCAEDIRRRSQAAEAHRARVEAGDLNVLMDPNVIDADRTRVLAVRREMRQRYA